MDAWFYHYAIWPKKAQCLVSDQTPKLLYMLNLWQKTATGKRFPRGSLTGVEAASATRIPMTMPTSKAGERTQKILASRLLAEKISLQEFIVSTDPSRSEICISYCLLRKARNLNIPYLFYLLLMLLEPRHTKTGEVADIQITNRK